MCYMVHVKGRSDSRQVDMFLRGLLGQEGDGDRSGIRGRPGGG